MPPMHNDDNNTESINRNCLMFIVDLSKCNSKNSLFLFLILPGIVQELLDCTMQKNGKIILLEKNFA